MSLSGKAVKFGRGGFTVTDKKAALPAFPAQATAALKKLGISFKVTPSKQKTHGAEGTFSGQGMIVTINTIPLRKKLDDPLNTIVQVARQGRGRPARAAAAAAARSWCSTSVRRTTTRRHSPRTRCRRSSPVRRRRPVAAADTLRRSTGSGGGNTGGLGGLGGGATGGGTTTGWRHDDDGGGTTTTAAAAVAAARRRPRPRRARPA